MAGGTEEEGGGRRSWERGLLRGRRELSGVKVRSSFLLPIFRGSKMVSLSWSLGEEEGRPKLDAASPLLGPRDSRAEEGGEEWNERGLRET